MTSPWRPTHKDSLIPSPGLTSDTAGSTQPSQNSCCRSAYAAGEIIKMPVHTFLSVASSPQSDSTAGKKLSSEEEGELDFFSLFFPNSVVCEETKRKRKSKYRRFSKSDFSGKQRKHLSEQSAEGATGDPGSSHLGKSLPSQALTSFSELLFVLFFR